jgi:hypothetical protein
VKKIGLVVFAVAVLALPLCAQVTTLRADIPFEFVAGTTMIAPGQYAISSQTGSAHVRLEGSKSYSVLSSPADPYAGSQEAKLVFHRYGDQYFLARISTASAGRDFAMSRTERELKKTASAAGRHETEVLVAMR